MIADFQVIILDRDYRAAGRHAMRQPLSAICPIKGRPANSMSMKLRHAAACARCGNVGKQRQLDELLRINRDEPIVVLCDQCVHLLRYADAHTWKWFREYRDRLSQDKS
jgi:hypothetical protein